MWVTPAAGAPYEPQFRASSSAHGLPAGLLSRMAYQESRYNPNAYNAGSGASGIMQIIPRFHPGVDVWDPFDSIEYAARWMAELAERFGSWALALAAYNAGPARVEQYGGIPPFEETQNYVREILADVGPLDLFSASMGGAAAVAALLVLLAAVTR